MKSHDCRLRQNLRLPQILLRNDDLIVRFLGPLYCMLGGTNMLEPITKSFFDLKKTCCHYVVQIRMGYIFDYDKKTVAIHSYYVTLFAVYKDGGYYIYFLFVR
jgi:hypothetical protein